MSQSDDDDEDDDVVCEHGVFGFTWYDVGRGFFSSICTHCAAERERLLERVFLFFSSEDNTH